MNLAEMNIKDWPQEWLEEWAERAAIIEYSCHLNRQDAERKAREVVIKRWRSLQK